MVRRFHLPSVHGMDRYMGGYFSLARRHLQRMRLYAVCDGFLERVIRYVCGDYLYQ